MRQILTSILAAVFLLSFAASGSAFTIQDDPLMFTVGSGGNQIVGEIDFLSATATNLEMTVQVTSGTLAGLTVIVCETDTCANIREPTGTGTTAGPDVDVTSHFIANNQAAFTFASFNDSGGGGGGGGGKNGGKGGGENGSDTSDPFDVDYNTDNLSAGDFIWFTLLGKKNKPAGTAHTNIVPEPAFAIVLLLGGAAAALHAGRTRRARSHRVVEITRKERS
jgi:hypothetical protein